MYLFVILLYVIVLLFYSIRNYNSTFKWKQDQITNDFYFLKKSDISICFVHKIRTWAIFGLTCKDKLLHDFVTVGLIFLTRRQTSITYTNKIYHCIKDCSVKRVIRSLLARLGWTSITVAITAYYFIEDHLLVNYTFCLQTDPMFD